MLKRKIKNIRFMDVKLDTPAVNRHTHQLVDTPRSVCCDGENNKKKLRHTLQYNTLAQNLPLLYCII